MRALALLIAATPLAAGATEVISPAPDSVSVTIYRDLFALVTETRTVNLPEGPVTLSFDGVVETLLPASAVVADTGRALEERNYDYDQLTPNHLFEKSVGRTVTLTRSLPGSGKVTQIEATIVSAGPGGIVLRTVDGAEALHCSGIPEQVTFREIPDNLHARPRLSIRLANGAAGPRTVKLSYLAHGFAWKSDYVARLDAKGEHVDLNGWVTLRNLTNATLHDVDLQLVAGKLHLLDEDEGGTSVIGDTDHMSEDGAVEARAEAIEDMAQDLEPADPSLQLFAGCHSEQTEMTIGAIVDAPLPMAMLQRVSVLEAQEIIVTGMRRTMATREELGDYHLYRVPWKTDLNARQTKQVAFLQKPAVKVERFYRSFVDAVEMDPDENSPVAPRLVLGFENRESSGLGEPLPGGILRLYEAGDGRDLFSGEGNIRDLPVGEPAEIALAGALDLALEVRFQDGEEESRAGETLAEIAEARIRIANAKGVPVTLEIRQPVNRYIAEAKVTKSNYRMFRKFGDFAWRLRVPANSAAELNYRLRIPEPPEEEDDD